MMVVSEKVVFGADGPAGAEPVARTLVSPAATGDEPTSAAAAAPIPGPRGSSTDRTAPQRGLGELVTEAAAAFRAYREGTPGAIDRLVRLVSPLLWHTARACGLTAEEAQDAVQHTFLTFVRRSETITDPLAVVRWLTVTLRRQAWRDRAASVRRGGDEPTDADLPAVPSAETAALLTDEQHRLWAHVRALSPRCQRLIAAIAFAPRPDYAAIAAELGMPMGSIGPTRGRCLAKLRSALQAEEAR